jgi:ribosomal protein S27AE
MDRIAWKRLAIGATLGLLAMAVRYIEDFWLFPRPEAPRTALEFFRHGWVPVAIGLVMGAFAGFARSRDCPRCGGTADIVSIPPKHKNQPMIYRCGRCGGLFPWDMVAEHEARERRGAAR